MKSMNISEASRKFDLSQDTLRYYERVGMIPAVNRTPGGLRDYTEEDCKWVELSKCMRSAGLPVEVMIEYLKLTQQGDETISARRNLLLEQRSRLQAQKAAIESTLDHLNFKIERYEKAMETGVLSWDCDEV